MFAQRKVRKVNISQLYEEIKSDIFHRPIYLLIRIIHVNNIVLYVNMFAVCDMLTLLSHWLAYDDLGHKAAIALTRVTKMCEMTHLHSTRMVFNNRRGHLRTQKASKPLATGEPHWGAYTAPQAR